MKQKLKTVTWIDACDHTDILFTDITDKPFDKLVVERETYGYVYEKDDVVVVLRDKQADGLCEITAIPKSWIVKIK